MCETSAFILTAFVSCFPSEEESVQSRRRLAVVRKSRLSVCLEECESPSGSLSPAHPRFVVGKKKYLECVGVFLDDFP